MEWYHLISYCPYPNLAQISLYKGCQRFCICCRHKSGKEEKPTILNTLTTVVVWNGNILYLAAPVPILPKFPYISPLYKGFQRFCICCRHKSGKEEKPTILNTLTTVGVWNGNILYLAALTPIWYYYALSPHIHAKWVGKRET